MSTILIVYGREDAKKWNECVKSFSDWDIYYLYEYAYSFSLHGDGEPFLIYYENKDERFCYVVMQRDIADDSRFSGALSKGVYYDWETPYGYGGPLTDGTISDETQYKFKIDIIEYCKSKGVVSQFVRFHPLLDNHNVLLSVIETRYMRDTIYMDTSDLELIMKNMDSKNRNMVRKAQKNGVSIVKRDITQYEAFVSMYEETMKKNMADEYYVFKNEYFEYLSAMKENAFIIYAMLGDVPISGSIMFYNDRYMHYHLSGSRAEYRKFAPSNLLLYEAACMACKKGISKFHLGGGMAPEDSLFGFKKQFNINGRAPFVVGRTIFDEDMYNELLRIRSELDNEFDSSNSFMIQYRR